MKSFNLLLLILALVSCQKFKIGIIEIDPNLIAEAQKRHLVAQSDLDLGVFATADPEGGIDVFQQGTAILHVPLDANLAAHLQRAGLRIVADSLTIRSVIVMTASVSSYGTSRRSGRNELDAKWIPLSKFSSITTLTICQSLRLMLPNILTANR